MGWWMKFEATGVDGRKGWENGGVVVWVLDSGRRTGLEMKLLKCGCGRKASLLSGKCLGS